MERRVRGRRRRRRARSSEDDGRGAGEVAVPGGDAPGRVQRPLDGAGGRTPQARPPPRQDGGRAQVCRRDARFGKYKTRIFVLRCTCTVLMMLVWAARTVTVPVSSTTEDSTTPPGGS